MTEEELTPVSPLALPQHKPARARHQPAPKKTATMDRPEARKAIEAILTEQNSEIKDTLSLAPEPPPTLLRRRTQDEMLRALRLLASDRPRPRDDDSPQVLEDAIYEVADLRQIVADLMQVLSSGYQQGLASIRKMTER